MPPNDPDKLDGETPPSEIEKAAADWFVLRDRGLTRTQRREFTRWIRSDWRHAEVYAEIEGTWGRVRRSRVLAGAASPAGAGAGRLRPAWIFAACAVAVVAGMAGAALWREARRAAPLSGIVSTDVGALRRLKLSDGSVLQLNTDSAVDVRFTRGERGVRLIRGEALFQVAKHPAWPFVVRADGVDVRAVGTAFDVRLSSDGIDVLVTEGKVRVDGGVQAQTLLPAPARGVSPLLVAGQRARIPIGATAAIPAVAAIAPVEVERTLAWQEGRLEFGAETLADIVSEFNRYNRHKLVIADPRLVDRRFGGTFPVDDYEAFVRSLEKNFGVIAERRDDETLLRLAP